MLRSGKYTPGQIDSEWTPALKDEFMKWISANVKDVKLTRAQLEEFMKKRTW